MCAHLGMQVHVYLSLIDDEIISKYSGKRVTSGFGVCEGNKNNQIYPQYCILIVSQAQGQERGFREKEEINPDPKNLSGKTKL